MTTRLTVPAGPSSHSACPPIVKDIVCAMATPGLATANLVTPLVSTRLPRTSNGCTSAAEFLVQPLGIGVRLAAWRDLGDRIQTSRPGLGYARRVGHGVLGTHERSP